MKDRETLFKAYKKGLITGEERSAIIAMDEEQLAKNMAVIEEALKGSGVGAKIGEGISNFFGGIGTGIGGLMSNRSVIMVVLVVLFLFSGGRNLIGKITGNGDTTVQRASGDTVEGVDRAAWFRTSDGLEVPINKALFVSKPLPINIDVQRARIAIWALLSCFALVAFDNAFARPNQAPNHKGNVGLLAVAFAFGAWSYWSVIIGSFGLYLCLRSRDGDDSRISNKFLLFALGVWVWFDQIAPIVNGWLDKAMSNPYWNWLPPLIRWLFEGENLRPLMFFAIIGFVIWSMWSQNNDSSTLIALLAGGVLVWFLVKGVFPFWENMPEAWRWPVFIALFALAVVAIVVEQVQVGYTQIPALIAIVFVFVFFMSLGIRDYYNIDPNGDTLQRWLTQPIIAVYVVMFLVSAAFSFAINHQSKVAVGLYNAAVGWFGSLVSVFGLRIPADGLISFNIIVAGILIFTGYAVT